MFGLSVFAKIFILVVTLSSVWIFGEAVYEKIWFWQILIEVQLAPHILSLFENLIISIYLTPFKDMHF